MERKLLSLPSFFVLLLVAGIAFLATPVVDVQAAAPTVSSLTAALDDDRENVVATITFSEAVKISSDAQDSAGTPGTDNAADGFGLADLTVEKTVTAPTAAAAAAVSGLTAASLKGNAAAGAIVANTVFTLTIPVPDDEEGSIKVTVKAAGSTTTTASFEAVTNDDDYAATTATSATGSYDSLAPSVTIALGPDYDASDTQTGSFEVRITLSQAAAATGAGVFNPTAAPAPATPPATPDADTGDITIVGASIGETDTTGLETRMIIMPTAGVDEVQISVAANAVVDAAGNGNAATDNDNTATGNQPLTVAIDNVPPTVTVAPAYPDAADQAAVGPPARADKDGIVTHPTTGAHSAGEAATFKVRVTIVEGSSSVTGDAAFDADDDVTVTGGSVSGDATLDATTLAFDYLLDIAQDDTTTTDDVTISVPAGAVEDGAGNGNTASNTLTVAVTGGDTPPPPAVVDPGDNAITSLAGTKVGFQFPVNLASNGFMVLSNGSKEEAGFTSAVTFKRVKDAVWQDLRHFLIGREGGTIDLIGPTGAADAKVRSLVISEVMWGNDNGLSTPADSQWIELYNTTSGDIGGTWELEFRNKHKGDEMGANDTVTTSSKPVVDKLSTWKKVGNAWEWRIEDKEGGSHGQSGKSTLNSATSPGSPVELVSMQRKIDYVGKVEKAGNDRAAQLKDFPDGAAAGGWEASKEHGDLLPYRKGTPGKRPVIRTFDKTGVPRGSVVFNEIANRSVAKHDWIELYNKSGSDKKINDWALSVVKKNAQGNNEDNKLFHFTNAAGDDIIVPAKGYLLIVNTDPSEDGQPLEGGYNVGSSQDSRRQTADGTGGKPARLYYVSDKLDIPEKEFLLILRHGNDKTSTHEKIEDIAGNDPDFEDANINTQVWPLRSWTLGATNDLGQNNDKTWTRDQGKDVFHGDAWKDNGGFTGVGIDRNAGTGNYTSGTPGYANNAVQNEVKSDGLTNANPVIISEIMFGTGNGRVPQWIELHNPSHTQAVNLNNWKLDIFNYHDDEELEANRNMTLTLPEVRIQPNQTVLIVSTTGRSSDSSLFPTNRRINVWRTPKLRTDSGMTTSLDSILSSMGFYLRLSDPKKNVVDEVGNLDGDKRTNDNPDWPLPGGNSDVNDSRSSMVRDIQGAANDGTSRDAWRDAAEVASDTIQAEADDLFYGHSTDVGTPGYTPGGVLPVQLSSFYSKRNDAGAVIITWSTESELDNAGFNLLRSSSRSGEFTKINAQLIPGAGTTGEKNTYTWTDTSARPNVVYYYQIQDVSLDGEHRTLRTTRLRGHVGAHGKLTTTWGVLKSRD